MRRAVGFFFGVTFTDFLREALNGAGECRGDDKLGHRLTSLAPNAGVTSTTN